MTDMLSVPMDSFALSRIYINGITSFSLCLFIHLVWQFWDPPKLLHASIVCSLYYPLLFHCVDIPQFIYSLNCWGTLDYFQCLDITNLAVLNIQVPLFLWLLFISTEVKLLGYICKYIFNFSQTLTVFHCPCTHILLPHITHNICQVDFEDTPVIKGSVLLWWTRTRKVFQFYLIH